VKAVDFRLNERRPQARIDIELARGFGNIGASGQVSGLPRDQRDQESHADENRQGKALIEPSREKRGGHALLCRNLH
jgi:hypothetical protein